MRSNRSRDTSPELAIRAALHRSGLRFRKHFSPIPGVRCEADVAFTRWRLALFVDGCFWHGCPQHKTTKPVRNATWWSNKLDANVARDRRNDRALAAAGWTVIRFWEHSDPEEVARVVAAELAGQRAARLRSGEGP